jgi:hypothetical protein
MTDTSPRPNTESVPPTPSIHPDDMPDRPGESGLERLRRLIREQLAGAVDEDRLDIDLANGMLTVLGLPELPRRWAVRIGLTFTCEVTAGTDHEAFDTAEDAIADAVAEAACPCRRRLRQPRTGLRHPTRHRPPHRLNSADKQHKEHTMRVLAERQTPPLPIATTVHIGRAPEPGETGTNAWYRALADRLARTLDDWHTLELTSHPGPQPEAASTTVGRISIGGR